MINKYSVTVSFKLGVDLNGNRSYGMPIAETTVKADGQSNAQQLAREWLSGQSDYIQNVARNHVLSVTPKFSGFNPEELKRVFFASNPE